MTHPENGSNESPSSAFGDLGINIALQKAVAAKGYTQPTAVQAGAIPLILQGKDVLGGAQTGTGKTAAFVLPILQRLGNAGGRKSKPRALILTPTRELAAQVHQSVVDYGSHMNLFSTCIYGGVGFNPQVRAISRGVDVMVATPGRLLDHIRQGNIDLSQVETFVLDEADRMLDMGFINDIRTVEKELPKKRQNLLFSATYSDEIRKLASSILNNPVSVEVSPRNTAADTVTHRVHPVSREAKKDLLVQLINEHNWYRILVFTRTKHGADRLSKQLDKDGITSAAIHGNKSQAARTRALKDFKAGKIQTLVATDIAARGIDIDELPHVVNFELPNIPEDYIHRIGRTGRAGAEGLASSLVSADENSYLKGIEKLLKKPIQVAKIEGYEQELHAGPPPHVLAGRRNNERGRQRSPNPRENRGPRESREPGNNSERPSRSGNNPRRQEAAGDRQARGPQRPPREFDRERSERPSRNDRAPRRQEASSDVPTRGPKKNFNSGKPGSGRFSSPDQRDFRKAKKLIDDVTGRQSRN